MNREQLKSIITSYINEYENELSEISALDRLADMHERDSVEIRAWRNLARGIIKGKIKDKEFKKKAEMLLKKFDK